MFPALIDGPVISVPSSSTPDSTLLVQLPANVAKP
jgi:hypothetical protein